MEIWIGVYHDLQYFKLGEHGYYFNNHSSEESLSAVLEDRGWTVDKRNAQDYPLVRNQMFNWE